MTLATVGASLVLATVIRNVSLTVALLKSLAVTVTSTSPTSAFSGVPENVRVEALKLNQPGKLLVVYVNESPTSTSANVLAANAKLNTASSVALRSGMALATVGASLVLATVIRNVSLTVVSLASFAVTVTSTSPTSAFSGVPENVRVPALKLNQPGRPLAV